MIEFLYFIIKLIKRDAVTWEENIHYQQFETKLVSKYLPTITTKKLLSLWHHFMQNWLQVTTQKKKI